MNRGIPFTVSNSYNMGRKYVQEFRGLVNQLLIAITGNASACTMTMHSEYIRTCICTQADLSEYAEGGMAELRLADCVQGTLDDRYHGMHVETRQHQWQLEGAQSAEKRDSLMPCSYVYVHMYMYMYIQ